MDQCFFVPGLGVPVVTLERWHAAQSAETNLWAGIGGDNDRWHEHALGFDFYRPLKAPLGAYIEIGCGPFTQSKHLLGSERPDLIDSIKSLTLLDPGIASYVQRVAQNSYRDNKLLGKDAVLVSGPSEQFPICEHYNTLTVINVAEHVNDVYAHLETIYYALADGGQIVFHDRAWPTYDPVERYHASREDWSYHPIRPREPILEHFLSLFEPVFCEQLIAPYGLDPRAYYLIGRKRPRREVWSGLYERGYVLPQDLPKFQCKDTTWAAMNARTK